VVFPVPQVPAESPRVRELSQRLQQTIQEFQRQFPMTPAEVRQAVRHVAGTAGAGSALRRSVTRTILFWLVVIALPLVVYWVRRALE
jgi:hypothetical protein